jgi:serine/threonine protein kinase
MPNNPIGPVASSDASARNPIWRGTARYEVVRCIGEGGMGVVYEAIDRDLAQPVALKTLQNFSPAALYRFKQEFRTLADVTHPNLVHLYELIASEESGVFFTMELVGGVDFLAHTQKSEPGAPEAAAVDSKSPYADDDALTVNEASRDLMRRQGAESGVLERASSHPAPTTGRLCAAEIDRLRPALRQLVQGVEALHSAGKLHRDIKPSNVLVTPAGRVVLLDFGVATELGGAVDERLVEHEVVGTVRYMAPEQATDEAPTAASDWYSVGAMLYEALVGQPPFVGPQIDVVTRKMMLDPRPPRECVKGVPADLDALCCDLLRREPHERPTGPQILRRLGVGRSLRPSARPAPSPEADGAVPLVGRESHLRALRGAFDDAKDRAVTVLVHGASGMGKSTLVEHFLDELAERGEAVTLRGRAYERESVPYKAFDSIVDALTRYLMRLSDDDGTVTLPGDIWALARLFPVLRRVAPIAAAIEPPVADPQYVRRHAFGALRALLGELARRQPLVLWIDDVQWGDVDSVSLLFEIVRTPVAPPMLVVLTYRDEEANSSPFVLEMRARWPVPAEVRDLTVGPLASEDARSLALTLLGRSVSAPLYTAEVIARESHGSAFLVEELVRSVVARQGGGGSDALENLGPVTLENMVGERLARLDPTGRRLVEIVAVGGRPLEVSLAGDAAGIYEQVEDVIAMLRTQGFVRSGFRAGRETVEMSHDGIRETIVGHLSQVALREHHGRLARVLESATTTDAEAIAVHLFGAGEASQGALYAQRAAEEATVKLAFDQAIRLYKLTIETIDGSLPAAREVRTRLAEVLEGAGRGAEAASVYLLAAEGAQPSERMELRRRAAEQLIQSGHVDEGIRMMRSVLEAVGMTMPRTAVGALFWLLVYRVWLWFRGKRFEERGPDEVRPLDRARIDACHAVAVSLPFVDAIFAEYMAARHLLLALRGGDRFRVLRALSIQTVGIASRGGPESAKERSFAEAVRALSKRAPEPDAWVYVDIIRALCVFLHGQWKELPGLEADLLVSLPHNRGGWRSQARMTVIWGLVLVGEITHVRRSLGNMIEDAETRGDLHTAVAMRVGYTNLCWLADDSPAEARRHLRVAAGMWSHSGFFLQNYRMILAEANIALYEGSDAAAYTLVVSQWRAIRRSLMLLVQYIRVDAYYLRARVALASLPTAPDKARRLGEAVRFAKALKREKMPWTEMLAEIVWASVRLSEGDHAAAIGHLRSAVERADDVGMALHAAAARYQLGTILGHAEGRRLVESAEDWMRGQDIRVPARFAAMLVPGRWAPSATIA